MKSFALCALVFGQLLLLPGLGMAAECKDLVSPQTRVRPLQRENFDKIIARFHDLGLTHLTEAYDQGLVSVQAKTGAVLSWRSDLSWRNTWFLGKRILSIRRLNWSNEAEFQLAQWNVARALYRLERQKPLWSARDMFPTNASAAVPSYNLPAVFTEARLAELNALEDDLYTLVENLDQVPAEDLLPAHHRGQPNLADRELRQQSGPAALAAAKTQRLWRRTIVKYYLDWGARLGVLAALTQGLVMAAPPTASYVSQTARSGWEWVRGAADRNQQVQSAERERSAEIQRLQHSIQVEESRVFDPNPKKIEELKQEYQRLKSQDQR